MDLEHTIIVGEIATHLTSQLNARNETAEAEAGDRGHIEQPAISTREIESADAESTPRKKPMLFRRDSQGRKRPFNTEGQEYQRQFPEFEQRVPALKDEQSRANMDDFTQKSSLTPTQANSESLYAQYDIPNAMRENNISNSQDGVNDDESENGRTQNNGQESAVSKQHHSAVTDSTAHTYRENDTGHVNFDFLQPSENQGEDRNQEMDENASQDASFAPRLQQLPHNHSFEPQTPAAPVNPFSQKGSVLKEHEMFGATQPSSIGRHIASPTSSRPSPDMYNNSSPQKRMTTSPLIGRGDETALQSSMRTMLRSEPADTPTRVEPLRTLSRSFDRRREPRDTYVSSKQSQERRKKAASASLPNSDSDTESDTKPVLKNRQREREREARIQRQLAQVTSTRPGSGSPGVIEVPSTEQRRRRSDRDEYLALCEGLDGQNTQQEDVIIDSQAIVEEPENMDHPETTTASAQLAGSEPAAGVSRGRMDMLPLKSSPRLSARTTSAEPQRVPDLYPNSPTDETSSPPKVPGSPLQQPSLPLQEVSTNRNDLRTPMPSKTQVMSDGADRTIPNTILETSPLGEDRIRPMGEIASLTSTENAYDAMVDDVPGFTQDVEYENAIRPRLSPTPPSRPRARDKDFPAFEGGNAMTASVQPPEKNIAADNNAYGRSDEPKEPKEQAKDIADDVDNGKEGKVAVPQDVQVVASVDAVGGPEQQHEDAVEIEDDDAVKSARKDETVVDEPRKKSKRTSKDVQTPPKAPAASRGGLRSKDELKGPSKALRRSDDTSTPKSSPAQRQSSRVTKSSSTTKTNSTRSSKRISDVSSVMSTPLSSLGSTPGSIGKPSTRKKTKTVAQVENVTPVPPAKTSTRKSAARTRLANEEAPVPAQPRASRRSTFQAKAVDTLASAPLKHSSKGKSGVLLVGDDDPVVTRSSKRKSTAQATRESSDDPLPLPTSTLNHVSSTKKENALFHRMAFAVSYVKEDKERSRVSDLIAQQGGRILHDGFDSLFETASSSRSRTQPSDEDAELTLSAVAKVVGFAALISDEHSRRAKYMQALALGLPCISGRWIMKCVVKGEVVDWSPYLLCAGQSSFLGNAMRSRTLTPYSAAEASFPDTFSSREKLLDGRSILVVTGKGQTEEKRRAYAFLTRVLGPARLSQVVDNEQARKKLLEDDSWDLLYVDKNESAAEATVFRSTVATGSKKRKRDPIAADEDASPAPKRIRIISDEVIIQSLILGQLLEE